MSLHEPEASLSVAAKRHFELAATKVKLSLQQTRTLIIVVAPLKLWHDHHVQSISTCFSLEYTVYRSRDNLLVRAPDLRSKGCEFEFRQERRENILLQS